MPSETQTQKVPAAAESGFPLEIVEKFLVPLTVLETSEQRFLEKVLCSVVSNVQLERKLIEKTSDSAFN